MSSSNLYTPELISELRELVKDCPTWLEARGRIEKRLGVHPDNITKMNKRHKFWMGKETEDGYGIVAQKSLSHDSFETEVETSKAATLEEVIEMCKVDSEIWESKGFSVRRGSKGYAWNARFAKRLDVGSGEEALKLFIERANEHSPGEWVVSKPSTKDRPDCLYVLNLQDLHLGKLAHGDSTGGADWDIRIAEKTYREAVEELIKKAPISRIEEVVVIVGSDMMQIDTDQSTTSKGTYVDSDSRLSKVFDVAAKMLTDVIEELASRFKVRAIVVAGNHDSTCSHFLGRYVESWFRKHPNVIVDSSPKSRKYYGYGSTLIGFDHGSNTRLSDLPLILMRENQDTISRYKYQEFLTGDKHHEFVDDIKGIRVRIAPALCSADKWHADKGYIGSVRQSQGLLYQYDRGLEAIFYSTPLD